MEAEGEVGAPDLERRIAQDRTDAELDRSLQKQLQVEGENVAMMTSSAASLEAQKCASIEAAEASIATAGSAQPSQEEAAKQMAVLFRGAMLFRGEASAVQVDVKERTVAFVGDFSLHIFATVRSVQRCPLGGKGYYEIEILERDTWFPQYGFAAAAFARVFGASDKRVGADDHSWAADGENLCTWHKGATGEYKYKCDKWKDGDVIGLACDLDKMQMHVSRNGSFAAPRGVVFQLAPDAVGDGLFAAFTGNTGKVRFNLGEADFRHAPPAADFQAFAAFEG